MDGKPKRRPTGTGNSCAVRTCNATYHTSDSSFFRFPKDLKRCRTWAEACDRMDLFNSHNCLYSSQYRVCSRHFQPRMFLNDLKNRLNPSAVPSVSLQEFAQSYSGPQIPIKSGPVAHSIADQEDEDMLVVTYSSNTDCTMDPLDISAALVSHVPQSTDINPSCSPRTQPYSKHNTVPIGARASPLHVEVLLTSSVGSQTSQALSTHTPRKQKLRAKIENLRSQMSRVSRRLTDAVAKKSSRSDRLATVTSSEFKQLCERFLPTEIAKMIQVQVDLHEKSPQRKGGCTRI